MLPKKGKHGLIFVDYPEFTPNLTPREIFELGSFGGTYWRPIYSSVANRNLKNQHLKYPKYWWRSIHDSKLISPHYDVNVNFYGVKCGSTLEAWEKSGWISNEHPYGWVQWYCDFYKGKRCPDDERQIRRWIRTAGPRSRFRVALINLIMKNNTNHDDYNISPKIRQTLQHWAYKIDKNDIHKK